MYREQFIRVRTVRLPCAGERKGGNGRDEFFAVYSGLLNGRKKLKQAVQGALYMILKSLQ